jgi:aspartyl-tRNA(Asn)/glutamyl-tRNA(Gln) amidotransferase subunit A
MSLAASYDLTGLAAAIRGKRVSSREAVLDCLAGIERLQPVLNCMIRLDAEQALAAADECDRELAQGRSRGPLHGVPLAHKDMYYRAGTVATCGSKIRRDFVPDHTATALTRLDAAGALQLGTLHMAEFAFGPTGHNHHFGPCRNPYDTARITGGSSSGSGSGVAAGLFYGALGSDTGGSIRLPAAFCNLVGMKPTTGRVSRFGAMPLSFSLDTVGPLTRSVRDNALMLRVIAGADTSDPTASDEPVPAYDQGLDRPLGRLRVAVPANYFLDDATAEVVRLLEDAAGAWRGLGVEVVEVTLPDLALINTLSTIIIGAEASACHAAWMRERPQDYSPQMRARLELGYHHSATRYIEALDLRGKMLDGFAEALFSRADALMAPVLRMPVPTIAETDVGDSPQLLPTMARITHGTRPINYLGLPALSLPAGFTAEGMPFGIQLVGRPFAEDMLFRLGAAFERETGWGRRAPALATA